SSFKKRILIGNLMVAYLSAFVILLVVLYEKHLYESANIIVVHAEYSIFVILFFYFAFAFLLSLAREISKDIEDIEGDRLYGCRTLPILIGVKRTKIILCT